VKGFSNSEPNVSPPSEGIFTGTSAMANQRRGMEQHFLYFEEKLSNRSPKRGRPAQCHVPVGVKKEGKSGLL